MIGTDPDLDLPSLSDTLSTIVSKVVTALSTLADSIATKATPAALNINAALDMGGNALTDVTSVQLTAGNVPSAAGSIYYYGGDFYAVDSVGTVQLTNDGALNASGIGGIGGDYGGANPAEVTYDDASGEYRFMQDGTTWADIVCGDVLLMEPSGSDYIRLKAPAIAASYDITMPSALPATTSFVMMSSAGDLSADNSPTVTGPVTASGFNHTDVRVLQISSLLAHELAGTTHARTVDRFAFGASTNPIYFPIQLHEGDRITNYSVCIKKNSVNTFQVSCELYKVSATDSISQIGSGDNNAGNASGFAFIGETLGTPETVTNFYQYYIAVHPNAANSGDFVLSASVEYDHPA